MEHEVIIVTCFDKQLLEWQENPAGKKMISLVWTFFISFFITYISALSFLLLGFIFTPPDYIISKCIRGSRIYVPCSACFLQDVGTLE